MQRSRIYRQDFTRPEIGEDTLCRLGLPKQLRVPKWVSIQETDICQNSGKRKYMLVLQLWATRKLSGNGLMGSAKGWRIAVSRARSRLF